MQSSRTRSKLDILTRFADQAVVSVGNLLMGILLARALGPAHFGVFAALWTVTLFAISSHWAWVASPMQTMPPSLQPESRCKMLPALLTHAIGIGALGALAALLVATYLAGSLPTLSESLAIVIALVSVLTQEFVRRWLLVTEKPQQALLSDTMRAGGTCLALYVIAYSGEVSFFEAFIVIGLFASIACLPIMAELASARFSMHAVLDYGGRHWAAGRWLMPFGMVQWAIAAAPIYALSFLVDSAAAGGYRAAVYLISPVIVLTEALETFLPLRTAEAFHAGGVIALKRVLQRYMFFLLAISVAYCTLVSVYSEVLLGSLFGTGFKEFHLLLVLLAVSAPLQNLGYIRNVQLRAVSSLKGILVSEIVAGSLLIALYVVIPLGAHGQGVAAAAIPTQAIKFSLLSWFAYQAWTCYVLSPPCAERT